HGGTFDRLMDGTAAVCLSSTQVATDLAAQAARCALSMVPHAAGRRIALAMERSATGSGVTLGPAIDRVASLLSGTLAPSAVALDDVAVRLLDGRFEVHDESGVFSLVGEHEVAEARRLLGRATPCVGRDRELGVLEGLFAGCVEDGAAQAVLVTAPPGV